MSGRIERNSAGEGRKNQQASGKTGGASDDAVLSFKGNVLRVRIDLLRRAVAARAAPVAKLARDNVISWGMGKGVLRIHFKSPFFVAVMIPFVCLLMMAALVGFAYEAGHTIGYAVGRVAAAAKEIFP